MRTHKSVFERAFSTASFIAKNSNKNHGISFSSFVFGFKDVLFYLGKKFEELCELKVSPNDTNFRHRFSIFFC